MYVCLCPLFRLCTFSSNDVKSLISFIRIHFTLRTNCSVKVHLFEGNAVYSLSACNCLGKCYFLIPSNSSSQNLVKNGAMTRIARTQLEVSHVMVYLPALFYVTS